MSAPRRQCPNCGVLTYGTHTFAECIEALREALMASEEDASEVHATALASARAEGAAEAYAEARSGGSSARTTRPDGREGDAKMKLSDKAWRLNRHYGVNEKEAAE